MAMKTIPVVAAVICDSMADKKRIFATARGYGDYKGWWEFPGGKVESGETAREALEREIWEELRVKILIGEKIDIIEWDYPAFHLHMECFWCEVAEGEITLVEAEAARWLRKSELDSVPWLPADLSLIETIRGQMKA